MSVFKAMGAVSKSMMQTGIEKSRKNAAQGYNFRGIDDFLQTLSPALVEHGLLIVPRYETPTLQECGKTTNGAIIMYAMVRGEFDLICVEDGSKTTAVAIGEGKDSGDKAISKAMSTAFKYMCAQTFCIPFTGMKDVEGDEPPEPATSSLSDGALTDWLSTIEACETLAAMTQTGEKLNAAKIVDPIGLAKITAAFVGRKKYLKMIAMKKAQAQLRANVGNGENCGAGN